MLALRDSLERHYLPAVFRSALADVPIAGSVACMVLDTMGELRDFYAAATVAHVGVDHNVLEPLAFGKPVTVKPGWNTTYPSYPVYRVLMDSKALLEADNAAPLAGHWLELLDCPDLYQARMIATGTTLALLRGAVDRHLETLPPLPGIE